MTERRSNNTKGPSLARRLGVFDATMIVMGGIIGAGIFVNPSVVAQRVNTPALVLCAWLIGGLIALIGAFHGRSTDLVLSRYSREQCQFE